MGNMELLENWQKAPGARGRKRINIFWMIENFGHTNLPVLSFTFTLHFYNCDGPFLDENFNVCDVDQYNVVCKNLCISI